MPRLKIFVLGVRGFPGVAGGIEKHCCSLYPRLVQLGCEVTVIIRASYVSKEKRFAQWRGVKFIYLWAPSSRYFEAITHTFLGVIIARLNSPDILHIHGIGPSILVPLAKLLGLKVVMTNHGPDYEREKWGKFAKFVLRVGEFLGTKFADKVIVISGVIKSIVEDKYGRRDLEFIPNGVDSPEFIPPSDTLRKYNLEPRKYIFTACRFVPEKGLVDLIEAYKRLENPEFKLVIAGDADYQTKYSKNIKKLAEEDKRITLTGFISGRPLGELFSNAGLFVLPSHYEGASLALLEAISYGLPVLVSEILANKEIPLPQFRYFPPGDIEVLSKKIVELFNYGISEEERHKQRELIIKNYNWDKIAERTEQVYKELYKN
jgi:glycosyltransferase involved in cell wall biosynthesis